MKKLKPGDWVRTKGLISDFGESEQIARFVADAVCAGSCTIRLESGWEVERIREAVFLIHEDERVLRLAYPSLASMTFEEDGR